MVAVERKRETRGGNLFAFSAQSLSRVPSSSASCGGSCNLEAVLLLARKRVFLSTPEGSSKTGDNFHEEASDRRVPAGRGEKPRRSRVRVRDQVKQPRQPSQEGSPPLTDSGARETESGFFFFFTTRFLPSPSFGSMNLPPHVYCQARCFPPAPPRPH